MTDHPTCGQGLAAHAVLPAKLGELTAAVAEVLEIHMQALELTDPDSRKEYEAYRELVAAHRLAGGQLANIAKLMAGCRNLPMGRHNMEAMRAPAVLQSYQAFVQREQELLELLQQWLEQDQQMLRGKEPPKR
jgi:hypothetical protein